MKNDYFLARYDKKDNLLGIYENIEEAVLKVYGRTKKDKLYKSSVSAICASYSYLKNTKGNLRSARGKWFKIQKDGE